MILCSNLSLLRDLKSLEINNTALKRIRNISLKDLLIG